MPTLSLQHEDGAAGHCEMRCRLRGNMVRGFRDYALQGNAEAPATSGARSVSRLLVDLPRVTPAYHDHRHTVAPPIAS